MTIALFLLTLAPLAPQQLEETADRLYQNECSRKKANLVHWKVGEEFPSLGIGHFIWYPEGQTGPFDEGFPKFIRFCQANNVTLPLFLKEHQHCPWNSREELAKAPQKVIDELTEFLLKTQALQAQCIAERLYQALPAMTKGLTAEQKSVVEARFSRVAQAPSGLYALIDYVNFKGEGTLASERYKAQGWGLLQVLQGMDDSQETMVAFRKAAKEVLTRRVANSPKERNEARWLAGWCSRIDTYK